MVNNYFHGDRSTQEILQDFALEMGLGTCTWDFALHKGKSQVPCILYSNGLSRLKSWDLASKLGLVHLGGTWDPM